MNELLCKNRAWYWGPQQRQAFKKLKELVSSASVLAFYVINPTVVSTDASGYGRGAVLWQQQEGVMKPIAYASQILSKAELGYASIEKECLLSTWAYEKFSMYLTRRENFTILRDHKPLIKLINSSDIDRAPARRQRLLLRLKRFNAKVEYVPGKDQIIADTLSCRHIVSSPVEKRNDTGHNRRSQSIMWTK